MGDLGPSDAFGSRASRKRAVTKTDRKPASFYAHGNTTWQQSCSHSAILLRSAARNSTTA